MSADWLKLIPNGDSFNECGFIREKGTVNIKTVHGIVIPTMMSIYEATYLYYIAKSKYVGNGVIVDLGPFLGLSTFVLLRGVVSNANYYKFLQKRVVYTFDLFLYSGYEWFSTLETETNSIFSLFYDAVVNYDKHLHVSPGNLTKMDWRGNPIEILFIDASKSWELDSHIVRTFFPSLSEGSIVVQQDYVFQGCYWIHITMEVLKDYFELTEYISYASAVYRCIKKLPESIKHFNLLERYPKEELIKIHMQAINAAKEPSVKEILKAAHALMLHDFGDYSQSRNVLKTVDINIGTEMQQREKRFNVKQAVSEVEKKLINIGKV